jgi:hypothetical protein
VHFPSAEGGLQGASILRSALAQISRPICPHIHQALMHISCQFAGTRGLWGGSEEIEDCRLKIADSKLRQAENTRFLKLQYKKSNLNSCI